MQHVMYDDIMLARQFVEYPYYEPPFDIENDECLYCYGAHKMETIEYLESEATEEYLERNLRPRIARYDYGEEYTTRLLTLFSAKNPSVRLSMYSGAILNRERVFSALDDTDDIKKVLLQLTGELNATAIDGLFSLYACSIRYFERASHTSNTKLLQQYYRDLRSSSYVYLKKGYSTGFFLMPLDDLEKAIDKESVEDIMNSASTFFDVYIKNNSTSLAPKD